MSSGGNSAGSTDDAVDKMFYCHQCNRTVTIPISSIADPFCPVCSGRFLEEYEEPNPNTLTLNPSGSFSMADPLSNFLPYLFRSSASLSSTPQPQSNTFDPISFLQNHLENLRSSGIHVQFRIGNDPSVLELRRPGNLGDYFFGPGLEQLIESLADNNPNRPKKPPASQSAIDGLPTVKVTKDMVKSEMNQCAICLEEFEDGCDVIQMPCNHVFYQNCLFSWLHLNHTCPVCRYELPPDESQQTPPRSIITIPLPSPFGRQDSSTSGAAPGTSTDEDNLETRPEDLD